MASGRPRSRRRALDGLLRPFALLMIILTGWLAAQSDPARLVDSHVFDRVTAASPVSAPQVVIITLDRAFVAANSDPVAALAARAEEVGLAGLCFRGLPDGVVPAAGSLPVVVGRGAVNLPASSAWRLENAAPASPDTRLAATLVAPAPDGLYRRQHHGLPGERGARVPLFESACAGVEGGESAYLVPMARAQNIPRLTASQLAEGVVGQESLRGLVGIVPPVAPVTERSLSTPLAPGAGIPASEFSAHAVQALRGGREVVRVEGVAAVLAVVLAALVGALATRSGRRRGGSLLLAAGGLALVLLGAWAALRFGGVLLPVTAMTLAALAAGLAEIFLREAERDRYLAATLEDAINLSFDRALFHDPAGLPAHLVELAKLLRLPGSAVIGGDGAAWEVLAQGDPPLAGLLPESAAQRRLFERTLRLMRTQRSADGDVWLAPVAGGDAPMLWLFSLPAGEEGERAGRLAREIAAELRQARGWQHRLLGGTDTAGASLPVDVRVASAAHLITLQGEQIGQGLEALDTAVLIFHPAGFPLHANERMQAVCEELGLDHARVGIIAAIAGLTAVERLQAEAIVRRMLLRGGEIRVPMREVAARNFVLRIGAQRGEGDGARRVIVLEAVDVSELDHLAALRLAVGVFIDRQLRNDLEAITLGATLALDPRSDPARQQRVAERIREVAARATGRLEDVAELLEETQHSRPGPCYPIEVRKAMLPALERVAGLAEDSGVAIDAVLPGISGFTLAEPTMLADLVEALLRLVVADTARGGEVAFRVEEQPRQTTISVTGGFGMPFDRLVEALDARPGEVPPEFQIASAGFAQVRAWKGSVAYWSAAGNGYKFTLTLRRIG